MNKKTNEDLNDLNFIINHPIESKENISIPHFNMENWTDVITDKSLELINDKKHPVTILLAGPSGGGKGEAAKKLEISFQNKKLNYLIFSTDNYYRGITELVFQPILQNNPHIASNQHQSILKELRKINQKSSFEEKFSDENLISICQYFANTLNYSPKQLNDLEKNIRQNFANLDFDNPAAINLEKIKTCLKNIHHNQPFTLPQYSMKSSEPTNHQTINPQEYDIIVIEGIYALNKEITNLANIKTFVEVPDKVHLLLRRLFRDVVGPDARTSFTPETALMINLRNVMPAATKHVLPTKTKAEYICENPHTLPEAVNTSYCEVQDKIKVSQQELPQIWKQIIEEGYKIIEKSDQVDHYLIDKHKTAPDKEDYQKYILRAREDNNQLELVYKGPRFLNSKNKIIRPAEILVKKSEFGTHYQNMDQLLTDFQASGFRTLGTITKKRILCQKNNIIIALDQVNKLGYFIEFITNQENQIQNIEKLKSELNLNKHPSYGPYIDQLVQQHN